MSELNFNRPDKRAVKIDPRETFKTEIDLSEYVRPGKVGNEIHYFCVHCEAPLIRGRDDLGTKLNQLDSVIVLDHAAWCSLRNRRSGR